MFLRLKMHLKEFKTSSIITNKCILSKSFVKMNYLCGLKLKY
jgi:hypothetical protein